MGEGSKDGVGVREAVPPLRIKGKDAQELKALGPLNMHSPEMEGAYLHKLHSSRWWGR